MAKRRDGRARGAHGFGLVAVTALAMAACGGEAESASDDESTRVTAPADQPAQEGGAPLAEAPAGPAEAEPEPAVEPAAAPVDRPAPTPRRREPAPAPAPEPVPAEPVAEAPEPEPAPEPVRRALPAGSTLELTLESALSTEQSRVGDTFWATVSEDILGEQSEVLVPIGSRVRGRVVESRESPSSDEPAVLRLEVESVQLNGAVRPLRATVVDVEIDADTRDSDGRTAVKVGVGAAAGAALGRILGRDRGATVTGAVAGAAAGTAVALATKDGQATIAQGARLVIRLDDALVVER